MHALTEIIINKTLYYIFQLSIQVNDVAAPRHTIQQTLQIEIEDINDNSPLFTQVIALNIYT